MNPTQFNTLRTSNEDKIDQVFVPEKRQIDTREGWSRINCQAS
jgi:hypothetical protein